MLQSSDPAGMPVAQEDISIHDIKASVFLRRSFYGVAEAAAIYLGVPLSFYSSLKYCMSCLLVIWSTPPLDTIDVT